MKILGVDWGEKRIGLAISSGSFAGSYGVVSSFEDLNGVIQKEKVDRVILGLPEGKHEKRVMELGKRIEEIFNISVILRSEVLTSRLAQAKLIEAGKGKKERRNLDAASAALLLQEYLDEQA